MTTLEIITTYVDDKLRNEKVKHHKTRHDDNTIDWHTRQDIKLYCWSSVPQNINSKNIWYTAITMWEEEVTATVFSKWDAE